MLDPENNSSMGSGGMNRSVDDETKRNVINPLESRLSYQQQTVLNLYNCGIVPEIIALQLDSTKKEVMRVRY